MNKDEFVGRKLRVTLNQSRPIPHRVDEGTWFLRMRARGEMGTAALEKWYYSNGQAEFFDEYEKQMKERDEKA